MTFKHRGVLYEAEDVNDVVYTIALEEMGFDLRGRSSFKDEEIPTSRLIEFNELRKKALEEVIVV